MDLSEVVFIALGLASDACVAAMCFGLGMRKFNLKQTLAIAAFFGIFQAVMPIIGWFIGVQFSGVIEAVDHWIAFGLLVFLGIKLIVGSLKREEILIKEYKRLDIKQLIIMSVATSIDALAVGVTFAFMQFKRLSSVIIPVFIIGMVTFILSVIGVICGNRLGIKLKSKAEMAGGIILIIIGLKILLEHCGIIPF